MPGTKGRRSWGWIARQKSKRYLASYIGKDLQRHYAPTPFTAKMDAEAWLANERKMIEQGTWSPPAAREAQKYAATITLADYAATWIAQRPVKPRTRQMYEDLLRLHITPTLGAVPIDALTAQAVRTWFAKLDPKYAGRNGNAYGLLHAVCNTAVRDELLTSNPVHIERAMNAPRKREPVVLTIAELAQVAEKIRPERLKAFVLLSAWSGARWGECIELRRKDISEGCEVVFIGRGVTHRGERAWVSTTKSGKPRAVVIPPHIREDLQHHLDAFVAKDADALLFPAERGGNCQHLKSTRVFRDYFQRALKDVGREGVTVHGSAALRRDTGGPRRQPRGIDEPVRPFDREGVDDLSVRGEWARC